MKLSLDISLSLIVQLALAVVLADVARALALGLWCRFRPRLFGEPPVEPLWKLFVIFY